MWFFLFKEKHNVVCDLIQEPFYLSNKIKWLALVDFFPLNGCYAFPAIFRVLIQCLVLLNNHNIQSDTCDRSQIPFHGFRN
jgi:hypothetical protein